MKLINTLLLIFLSFALCCLSGCLKKGEDDPLISLRTRKARLTGQWYLTNGMEESTSISVDSLGRHESKTTSVYTRDYYSYSMEFKKDGGFSSEKTDNSANTTVLNGTWNFTKGIGKHKNKEQVVINLNSNSTINTSPYSQFAYEDTFKGNQSDLTYTLKELRNKKLVLVYEYSYIQNNGYESSTKSELTFEQ